ncbi:flagellar basal-body MS-ring/collar protein FliF [Cytobacillus sp. IB215665]|uniref:flagellar basal-body MS-ring/collar protein FliF n=1 Tax=Cytobacillus sp. IB215665 TaxID=3097357 RepID=UPI002A0B28C5|nr:flagellar basal-body MS-ring/collar protein FliF [Cytobacillus sp. IB215665]MDX8365061.1 flagellar basal-body MS-ring/collar protein FliF [Cytobacillus sp. IB215665]
MNELIQKYKTNTLNFWNERSKTQKAGIIGAFALMIVIISVILLFVNNKNFQPLYVDLTPQETGQIKATLDSRGIASEISNNGTTIYVPADMVDSLLVELAAEGIPESGSFDYADFGNDSGLGTTENEFNMLKLEATQTELANLIKGIDGVQDATVMIYLPEPALFVNSVDEEATASIVLQTKDGYKFEDNNIKALYHLVSKSIPNLPTDNIVIMNQHFQYFDLNNENNYSAGSIIANQLEIKRDVERGIQRQVQQMLGMMMGQDKVVVSVTTDLDFTQENRQENLVTATDPENNEGIAISAKRITETFTGSGAQAGGIPGTGENEVTNYPGVDGETSGDYERIEETINNEVNRITKEIVESPYKVRDLSIQVMVEPPVADDRNSLPVQQEEDIKQILSTIVRTTINQENDVEELTEEELQQKVVVSVAPFNGKTVFEEEVKPSVPTWVYIVGGLLLLTIIILIILLVRKRSKAAVEDIDLEEQPPISLPDVNNEQETETLVRKKQLEKMAQDKPEDFAKLLRSWLSDD